MKRRESIALAACSILSIIFILSNSTNSNVSKLSTIGQIICFILVLCLNINVFFQKIAQKHNVAKNILFSLISFVVLLSCVLFLEIWSKQKWQLDWYYHKVSFSWLFSEFRYYKDALFFVTASYIFSIVYVLIKFKLSKIYNVFTWLTTLALCALSILLIVDFFKNRDFNPEIKDNPNQKIVIYGDGGKIDIDKIINDTTFAGKTKIIYFWTPSCGMFNKDLDLISSISEQQKDVVPIYIAGENEKCNSNDWALKTKYFAKDGMHIFLPRKEMQRFYFDELSLNGMPGVIILSGDNKILYKGHTRIGSLTAHKQIDFKKIINE